jgi:hypothetical protein
MAGHSIPFEDDGRELLIPRPARIVGQPVRLQEFADAIEDNVRMFQALSVIAGLYDAECLDCLAAYPDSPTGWCASCIALAVLAALKFRP